MPNYQDLFKQGIYDLGDDVRVFAGTVDDPFYIDLGAAFDSLNFRMGVGGVLFCRKGCGRYEQLRSRRGGGFQRNAIVLEVPTTMLTADGEVHPAGDKNAVIGTYGATSRRRITIRRHSGKVDSEGQWRQVNREGNSLINELIIGNLLSRSAGSSTRSD